MLPRVFNLKANPLAFDVIACWSDQWEEEAVQTMLSQILRR